MEKIMKLFTSEKRKGSKYDDGYDEDKNDFTPPLDDRRKLSISRSGRMRQANKKRQSLCLDVYGETNQPAEKPKSREYHVNPVNSEKEKPNKRRHSGDPTPSEKQTNEQTPIKTPEEEIESAFEVIDKIS